MIDPTAIVSPQARLHPTVVVGPYAVIEAGVVLGEGCSVGPHVHLTGLTTIGARNRFHAGCVVGDAPQDFKYGGEPTRLRIGDDNTFREHVTVHRSNSPDEETVVGHHNLFMAHSHVGHNTVMGDHNVLVNGALLGGHVTVGNRAILSGHALVHQFVRIGSLAMMQGGAAITRDLPPFCMATGLNSLCGLNLVGLRRAGFTAEQRRQARWAYQAVFLSGKPLRQAADEAQAGVSDAAVREFLQFIQASKRGVCAHRIGRGAAQASEKEMDD